MTLHLELLLQVCPAIMPWCHDAVKVAVKLAGPHFCLLPQNGFHQGIVDEDVLLLDQIKSDKIAGGLPYKYIEMKSSAILPVQRVLKNQCKYTYVSV